MLQPFFFTPFVAQSEAPTTTIDCPARVDAGDILVLFDTSYSTFGLPTYVIPSGFTLIDTATISFLRNTISYKIADGTEGGTPLSGMGDDAGTIDINKMLLQFRSPPVTTAPISGLTSEITTGNPAQQTVSEITPDGNRIVLASYLGFTLFGQAPVASATFDPPENVRVFDNRVFSSSVRQVRFKACVAGDSFSFSVDMDDEFTNNCMQSFIIAPTP